VDRRAWFVNLHSVLTGCKVAISVSESADMPILGLGPEHLVDAMSEITRHVLALGASVIYGGDLRVEGFARVLFELALRRRDSSQLADGEAAIENLLAWPVHIGSSVSELEAAVDSLDERAARLVFLSLSADILTLAQRRAIEPRNASASDWRDGLTSMRRHINTQSFARITLGGRIVNYKGRMPGIAEEVLVALESRHPIFILGGVGGCARDIAHILGLARRRPASRIDWKGSDLLSRFDASCLNNGLNDSENERLALTPHIDESTALIVRGLLRLRRPA